MFESIGWLYSVDSGVKSFTMPTNKNADLRYKILDRCFSDRNREYEIEDLKNSVNETLRDLYGTGVSIRQIRDDIKYMRDRLTYNAPIKAYPFDGKKCYYRYEDENFSIFKNELSLEELTKLRSTLEMLNRYRGLPANAWLEEVISSLEYRFGIKSNNENIVSFEQNEGLKGLEFLSQLIDSTVNHQPLRIVYKKYGGKEFESIVHPYHIKQYNNRWFLFGLEENDKYGNYITNKALDRIISISKPKHIDFIPNRDIDFVDYFKDVVGVSIPRERLNPEEIILRFSPDRFPYAVSKPIHSSQNIINEEESIIRIKVRPNNELEQLIFSFGPDVEILSPAWFREEFSKKIAECMKKYLSVQNGCTFN